MPEPRFLQIHYLAPYTAALLNRDDAGLAKRLPYGGFLRTRVSSQCLKRHWRLAEDPHAMSQIKEKDAAAIRSRQTVEREVIGDLTNTDGKEVAETIRDEFLKVIYGEKGTNRKSRQTLLLGEVEITYLRKEARRLFSEAKGDKKRAQELAEQWSKEHKKNLKALSVGAKLPGGLTGALFGRMVTSDPEANIEAPVHVAHAFTVHAEEAESDYFIAADDLARDDETGADAIQETELTSCLFYGYVVVDVPGLLKNLAGDTKLAGDVLHNLTYLIAEVSPGAKLGSTAPYSRADLMLLEAGNRQPRSLAEAFRKPCKPMTSKAVGRLADHLAKLDENYATDESRRVMTLVDIDISLSQRCSLKDLAAFARDIPAKLLEETSK